MSGVGASTGSADVMGATVSEPTTVPELVEGTGTLYGVGVGPGDPELMTLKAARLIGSSPVVAYHQARGKHSNARGIAASLIGPEAIEEVLEYPVTTGTTAHPGGYEGAMAEFYDEAAERLAVHLAAGRDVALLSEGDPLLYGCSTVWQAGSPPRSCPGCPPSSPRRPASPARSCARQTS